MLTGFIHGCMDSVLFAKQLYHSEPCAFYWVQRLDFVDVATGSLGQGLSVGAGMAYTGKHFDKAE